MRATIRQTRHHGECDSGEQQGVGCVERTPAECATDHTGKRPRQQNAEHQTAHHIADDFAARSRRRERRGRGHQHLHDARCHADGERCRQKHRSERRASGQRETRDLREQRRRNQGPIGQAVDQRNEPDEADRIAEQRQCGDERGPCAEMQRGVERADQGL